MLSSHPAREMPQVRAAYRMCLSPRTTSIAHMYTDLVY